MKKVFTILMAMGILGAFLVGCGGDKAAEGETAGATAGATAGTTAGTEGK